MEDADSWELLEVTPGSTCPAAPPSLKLLGPSLGPLGAPHMLLTGGSPPITLNTTMHAKYRTSVFACAVKPQPTTTSNGSKPLLHHSQLGTAVSVAFKPAPGAPAVLPSCLVPAPAAPPPASRAL